ncbi:hypothetical protein SPRG_21350 [Saprolegnia parasitica CBS 223.65]|uniref:BRCT domain-containing protein n=1 Tax=Saprolegnia parasitica (strain CBS 223.65) TaxID=695850 RepID=A0A067C3B6_SAPPC|nr:hypothetical protein SPRG_21350 [Saprolegnia parasitica CBS 223.65]KDO21051.1 hypothetical protein SPRG_21350 [Saprolegnia parasitica CBS 223.65]|eukprot:XP_012208255.1 hypothetical protein SPRG_21350 [Saprolegnia parasitica CBS 223.65]
MTGPRSLFAGMKFHVQKRTLARDKAEELIKEHGGEVVDENVEGRILLMDNQRLEKHADDHLNVDYIYECVKKKMLIDRDPFMAPADWAGDDGSDNDNDEPEARPKRTRSPYTLPEQAAMLQFKRDMHLKLNQSHGCHRKFWTLAASKKVTNRTMESMLDHHKRRLMLMTLPQLREILTHFKGYAGDLEGSNDDDDNDGGDAAAARPTRTPLPVEPVKAPREAFRGETPRAVSRKQPHRTSRERRVPLDESEGEDFTDKEVPPPMFSTPKKSTRLKRSQRSSHSSGSESDTDVVTRPKKQRVSARAVLSDENNQDEDENAENDDEGDDDGVVPDSQQSHDSAATIDDATQTEEAPDAAEAPPASKHAAKKKKAAAPSPVRPKASKSLGAVVPRHKHTMRPIVVPGVVASPPDLAPFPMSAPTTPAQLRALRKFMFLHSGMPDDAIDHALYSSCGNPVLALRYLRGSLPLGCWTPDDDSWIYENISVTSLTLDVTDEALTALIETALRSAKPTRPHPLEMVIERLRFLVRELSMAPAPAS